MNETLGYYYKNSDCSGRSFMGRFFIKNGEPSNPNKGYISSDTIDFVDLEYIVVPKTMGITIFEALFDYQGERYRLREDLVEHLHDKEIPVSRKSKKTLVGELVAQPALCIGD